jgi:hypothetical protein
VASLWGCFPAGVLRVPRRGAGKTVQVSTGDLDEVLLDHLVVEFFDHGQQAVEFLRSAQVSLSAPPADAPRVANMIAYCLREAMKAIPASQDVGGGGQWRMKSRSVVEAKRRYELTRSLPGQDSDAALQDLLACIDDMASTHQEESIHQKRLIAVIVNRTGAQPLASGVEPVRAYQDLLTQLDEAVHPGHRAVSIEEVRQMWTDCLAILRQLFLPPEVRHHKLDVLAAVDSPGPDDVSTLMTLLAGPNHLQYFLSRIQTPAWLDVLTESVLLEPPTGQAAWPVFAAVTALKDEHGLEVSAVLLRMMERWESHPQQAFYLARAAVDLGTHAVLAVSTNRSAKQFALGQRGGIFTTSMPTSARTASNDTVNWPALSRTRNRNWSTRSPRSITRFRAC